MAQGKGYGKVYLIGAGPGDPGLLTIKAAEAISSADVLVFDRLAHPRVLQQARKDAEKIYVGKLPDRHTLKQNEINHLLVDLAKQGKTVARVKGGDPFVFGRGGEEAEELAGQGIAFEVIPGVTSAIAVPAYAGIPVTHRDHTSALGIITGHEDPNKENSALRWEHLAKGLDTLVFLMGVGNLPEISLRLIANGRAPDTPVGVIQWGTRPEQKVVTGTLETIAGIVEREGISSPAVTVVGDVVRLREKLRWFDIRPLFGKRVIVTRTREQASELTVKLEALGAEVLEHPSISCRPLSDTKELDQSIVSLSEYDWIIFTSVNGVQFFVQRLFQLGSDIRALSGLKIAAMGEATKRAIEGKCLRVDFTPSRFVGEAFVEEFPASDIPLRVLLPRAAEAREIIPEQLRGKGHSVNVVSCYETVACDEDAQALREALNSGTVDFITFTSSSTAKNFAKLVWGDSPSKLPEGIKVVSIGPITSKTVQELGMPVDAEADEHTITGLVDALVRLA